MLVCLMLSYKSFCSCGAEIGAKAPGSEGPEYTRFSPSMQIKSKGREMSDGETRKELISVITNTRKSVD